MNLKSFASLLLIISLSACASAPRFTNRYHRNSEISNQEIERKDYENSAVLETTEGTASFYADKYHGRITYSGVVYDMNGISAAHQTYQMGTILRVTNLENNKNVILEVNDRMPYHEDRIIDLSLGTAEELDFVNDGLVKVRIEVLKWGEGKK
jgi:rare lipoprotein A (peptidoglycan hydrolase)